MKSSILAIGIGLFGISLNAQTNSNPVKPPTSPAASTPNTNPPANTVAPKTESKPVFYYAVNQITTEGILNIQLMNAPLGIVFDELKIRYFKSGDFAYRVRGNIKMVTSNETINGVNNKNANIIETTRNLKLYGGIEKHLKTTGKFSGYYGGEVGFLTNSNTVVGQNTADGKTFKENYKFNSDNTEFGYYLGGVAGLDYFFHPSFYIGTEVRLGYESLSLGTMAEQVTDPNNIITGTGNSLGTNTKLELTYTQGLRIGFKF